MKSILFALILVQTVIVTNQAEAKPRTKTEKLCASFQAKENEECEHIMCDEEVANGNFESFEDCVGGDGYGEAASEACYDQPNSVEKQVERYNKKHPTEKIKCE